MRFPKAGYYVERGFNFRDAFYRLIEILDLLLEVGSQTGYRYGIIGVV